MVGFVFASTFNISSDKEVQQRLHWMTNENHPLIHGATQIQCLPHSTKQTVNDNVFQNIHWMHDAVIHEGWYWYVFPLLIFYSFLHITNATSYFHGELQAPHCLWGCWGASPALETLLTEGTEESNEELL